MNDQDFRDEPFTRGEFQDWDREHCEPRFKAIEDILKNGIQGDMASMKGTMKIMIPLLIANLALIVGVVALIISFAMWQIGD